MNTQTQTDETQKTNLIQDISVTFENLYAALQAIGEEKLDCSPAPNSWSAGQVAEHLIKGMGNIGGMGVKTAAAHRPKDAKVAAIKDLFLDFTTKLSSPEFILPTAHKHDLKQQLHMLKSIEEQHQGMAEDADLSLESLVFELPGFGTFTLYEWIVFNIVHAQRHTHQLQKIRQSI
ncbi:DinB family protein [Flavobacterium magnum]|uniref:DinB family protein n=1 Tax=Flavobacterium magnum TaxID=2162713 RepID=A0A2S0RDY3_9FLAO|nr:DinB family protein [Flavobacterium magnum]AWA29834.1 DinB family protein [Flavobacterium magnum]